MLVSFRGTASELVIYLYNIYIIFYIYIYTPLFLDYFAIQTITEYWIEFLVLKSRSLLIIYFIYNSASLVAQMANNPSATQESWDRPLGQEHPLEEGMETYSSILAWRIPGTEDSGGPQSMGSQGDTTERLNTVHLCQSQFPHLSLTLLSPW